MKSEELGINNDVETVENEIEEVESIEVDRKKLKENYSFTQPDNLGKIIEDEGLEKVDLEFSTIKTYFTMMGGWKVLIILVVFCLGTVATNNL